MRTIDRHFDVSAAPAAKQIKLHRTAKRLTLDLIDLQGGGSRTVQATLAELIPSFREIEIVSADEKAVDTFTPGRTIRGMESGQWATVVSQRTANGVTYLQYDSGGLAKFFEGETIEERNLTGTDVAALANVNSAPTQSYTAGEQIADTMGLSADGTVDIAPATQSDPNPNKPRLTRLEYVLDASVTSASWVLRVS